MSHEPIYGQPQTQQFTPEQIAAMQGMLQQAPQAQAQPQPQAQAQAPQGQPQFTPEQIATMQAMQAQQTQQTQGMPNIGGMPGQVQQMPETKPELPNNFPGMAAPAEMPSAPEQQPQMNHMGMGQQAQAQHPQMSPEQMQAAGAQQQMPGMNPNYVAPQAQAPQEQYNPAMQQQQQVPGYGAPQGQPQPQYNPMMQQQQVPGYGAPQGQPQPQYNPMMQQHIQPGYGAPQGQPQPQYNPAMQQQQVPGQSAPGYNGGSYLNNGTGVGGPTPTGHTEKQKFNGRALLVFASAADSKKQNRYCRGLLNPHPEQRNGQSYNFICFSKHSAYQIDIIENAAIRANYTRIEKAAGQPILFEGHWEWNTGGQTPAWQLMIESFSFEQDPNLKIHADNYVPPIPASPMDMINGGNMGMGQQQMGGYPPMGGQGQFPGQQQMGGYPPMGGQPNPHVGQPTPTANYGQGQFPGQQPMMGQFPGMPGQH